MSFLGSRLATRRKARGFSRDGLGALIGTGLPAAEIAAYETGEEIPSPIVVRALAKRLGCAPADFFDRADDPLLARAVAVDEQIRAEVAAAPRLSDEAIEHLRRLLPAPPRPEQRRRAG